MRALNDVQYSLCKELYVVDLPLYYDDVVELVKLIIICLNYYLLLIVFFYIKDKFHKNHFKSDQKNRIIRLSNPIRLTEEIFYVSLFSKLLNLTHACRKKVK